MLSQANAEYMQSRVSWNLKQINCT